MQSNNYGHCELGTVSKQLKINSNNANVHNGSGKVSIP